MKKLMIAAAIVCAAAFANAANYTWGQGSYCIDNWNGNQPQNPDILAPMYEGGTIFLYLGTVSYTKGTGFSLAGATLLASATYDAANYMYGDLINFSTGDVDKMGGQAYTMLLVNDDTYTGLGDVQDGDYFTLRTGTSASDYDGVLEDNYAIFADYDAIAKTDWTKFETEEPTPEPTSAMLMLLGMAGLALRRKQK